MKVSETEEGASLYEPYERTADGGFIIKRTDEFVIDVVPMIYNWRLHVATPEAYGAFYEKGYCFFGLGLDVLVKAVTAAEEWAKGDPFVTDPPGFDKRAY